MSNKKPNQKIGCCVTTINLSSNILSRNISYFSEIDVVTYVSGDRKTGAHPANVLKNKSNFISYDRSPLTDYENLCPFNSYSRKNIAFIEAIKDKCDYIYETDDDNLITCSHSSWAEFTSHFSSSLKDSNQLAPNLFSNFYDTDKNIWARGYPIEFLDNPGNDPVISSTNTVSGVVQFLVDGNPDVDAIFRLVMGNHLEYSENGTSLPFRLFNRYHPFNSQSTLWPKESFQLMYLPSTCEFRMTDIWRGYIAQAILYSKGLDVCFLGSNVYQLRNEHRISTDFFGEHTGYLQSKSVIKKLSELDFTCCTVGQALLSSYQALVDINVFHPDELELVKCWLSTLETLR